MKVRDIYDFIDGIFPFSSQAEWDNSGFQVGSLEDEVIGIIITLDVDDYVIENAIKEGINLIISHHPLILKKINRIWAEKYSTAIIYKAIRNGINIISAHTNVDILKGGLADYLAGIFKLEILGPLSKEGFGRICSLGSPITLEELLNMISQKLNIENIRVIEGKTKKIKKVALCPGSGGDLIEEAIEKGIDAYITGDVKYHQAKLGEGKINILDIGHHESEIIFVDLMYERIAELSIRTVKYYSTSPFKTRRLK
ncbi:MAG: Nif3-like dinuclear metal center hexameric protein [Thermosulfidibacteraceae bacterium]|jgi:dinuclear metal center YbgI/SA1388 family protein